MNRDLPFHPVHAPTVMFLNDFNHSALQVVDHDLRLALALSAQVIAPIGSSFDLSVHLAVELNEVPAAARSHKEN
jgi:hypothetical protein